MKNTTLPVRRQSRRSASPITIAPRFILQLCALTLGAAGCAGMEDLGATDEASQNLEATPALPFYEQSDQFAGRWIGQAEEPLALEQPGASSPVYRFPSGSSQIVLELDWEDDPDSFPGLTGTIVFGAGAAPPPPTDPDVGYPVGLSYVDLLAYSPDADVTNVMLDGAALPPLEGFTYSISNVGSFAERRQEDDFDYAADGVTRLAYVTSEYLEPWCTLQTPASDGQGGYYCLPQTFGNFTDEAGQCVLRSSQLDQGAPVDCDKMFLCGQGSGVDNRGRCACSDESCWGEFSHDLAIMSLRRSGDTLIGVINDGVFLNERGLRVQLGTVRFQRSE
jgi:hypothetical protein